MLLVFGLVSPARADEPAARSDYERPWLVRGGRLIVIEHTIDPLRGMHAVSYGTRELRGKNKGHRVAASRALLTPGELQWFRRNGEYDLYRAALARAVRRAEEKLLRGGWQAVVPLEGSVLRGHRLLATFLHDEAAASSLIVISRAGHGGRLPIGRVADSALELEHQRRTVLRPTTLVTVARSADGRWLMFTVGSDRPLHGEHSPTLRVFAVPAKRVIRALALPAVSAGPVG